MKVTATGNFETKKSWSRTKKHMEHADDIEHSNKFLNTEESKKLRKFNQHVELVDFDKWTNEKFGNYVISHDQSALKHGRSIFGSVENFLKIDSSGKTRTKSLDILYYQGFANSEDYQKILNEASKTIGKDKAYEIISNALVSHAKGFNKRNKNLVMFEAYTHLDEKGVAHYHGRIMPYSESEKTKKPSWSLGTALKREFDSKDKRASFRAFRKQEDQALIDAINKQFELEAPNFAKSHHFELYRKTDEIENLMTGREHETYKKVQETIDKAKKQAKHAQETTQRLKEQENDAFKLVKTVKQQKKELDEREVKLDNREKELDDRENYLNRRDEDLDTKSINIRKRSEKLSEDENRLKERENNLKLQEQEVQQQKNELQQLKAKLLNLYNSIATSIQGKITEFTAWLRNGKTAKEKTISHDMSLLQQAKENGSLSASGDSSLQEMFLKKHGRDEDGDGIDDTKEANHNMQW